MSPLETAGPWISFVGDNERRAELEARLALVLPTRRWFRDKSRGRPTVRIADAARIVTSESEATHLLFLDVDFADGARGAYVLPLAFASGDVATRLRRDAPHLVLSDARAAGTDGLLYDAVGSAAFLSALLAAFVVGDTIATREGELRVDTTRAFGALASAYAHEGAPTPFAARGEQTNTSMVYGTTLILKLLRKLEAGESADLEVSRYLTDVAGFASTPEVAGALTYTRHQGAPMTLGILQRFVANEGDAWEYTKRSIGKYLASAESDVHADLFGYLSFVGTLGLRTAEMHRALAARADMAAFAPVPLSRSDRRALVDAATRALTRVLESLRARAGSLEPETRRRVLLVSSAAGELEARVAALATLEVDVVRTRVHGDFHLGQVLVTRGDVAIIDFEGEPSRTPEERRSKRSPLADVAGMVRSLHYAAMSALVPGSRAEVTPETERRARAWYDAVKERYLSAYFEALGDTPLAPLPGAARQAMLDFYLLEKCIYEVGYELDNRPDWLPIPLEGLASLALGGAVGP